MGETMSIIHRDSSDVTVQQEEGYIVISVGLSPERGHASLTPTEARRLSRLLLMAAAAQEAKDA